MARYIPQSKINILQTTGTEFVVESTNRAYQGSYIEYSDGSFFAGNNPENPGGRLIRKKIINNSFGISNNNTKYRNLKKTIYNNLSKVIPIPPSKPLPTNNDYKKTTLKDLEKFKVSSKELIVFVKFSSFILKLSIILSFNSNLFISKTFSTFSPSNLISHKSFSSNSITIFFTHSVGRQMIESGGVTLCEVLVKLVRSITINVSNSFLIFFIYRSQFFPII